MKRNHENYSIEFSRSLTRYDFKSYTWFVYRPNYDRDGFHSSDTVWMLTTDSSYVYDMWKDENVSKSDFILFIKSHPATLRYNDPVFYY